MKIWIPHGNGRALLGEVPASVTVEVCRSVDSPPSDPADVEFWVPAAFSEPTGAGERMPSLRVVQLLTAGADAWAGRLPDRVELCDAKGVHDAATSEWVVTAILAHLRRFQEFALAQRRREWARRRTDQLAGKRVLIVGAGSIGGAVARRIQPFEVEITMVARRAREGVLPVGDLPSLLPNADVVVLLLPLTPETTGLVDAEFLAALPDGALLVNASRGPVADTEALTKELASGRIGAALDVTDPEPLPADHPLWGMPNVLITPHVAGDVERWLPRAYALVRAQLLRHVAGEPLENVVTEGY